MGGWRADFNSRCFYSSDLVREQGSESGLEVLRTSNVGSEVSAGKKVISEK
jgi:hypothetical protein